MEKPKDKLLIAPFQQLLLKKGMCVACFMPLKEGKVEKIDDTKEKVTCRCRRIYIHTISDDTYRRALQEEV
jgi:hypothetical protein